MNTKLPSVRRQVRREGFVLLLGLVALMWVIQIVNSIDGYRLDTDGLYPHNLAHIWGILTSPFLHKSYPHLIDNTVPLVFMGLIIALRGAVRLAKVTAIVIVAGGIGTWLISPSGTIVVGASGLVFGYAGYLLTRGLFNHSLLEALTGVIVGAVWGATLVSSLVPHDGISWQGHLCGALSGVLAAWVLSGKGARTVRARGVSGRSGGGRLGRGEAAPADAGVSRRS
ncbi:MAG: rhomboid family intramembrane serine protease [Solirubrobacteraceae bacterium]